MRRWFALITPPIVCCIAIILCASAARADPPQRALVGNFIGYDALPENYLSISGSLDRAQDGESLYLEKTISPDSSISLFAGYQRLEQEGETTTGFTNLSLAYKHVLISIPRHEFMLSLAPEAEVPVGNRSIGSESHAAPALICSSRRDSATWPIPSRSSVPPRSRATWDGKVRSPARATTWSRPMAK